MKRAHCFFGIATAIACVSNRERRQSVLRLNEPAAHRYRDSVWSLRRGLGGVPVGAIDVPLAKTGERAGTTGTPGGPPGVPFLVEGGPVERCGVPSDG